MKLGGGTALHHNKPMLVNTLFVTVSSNLVDIISLPFPDLDGQDIPLQIIGDVIGYIILWPWKLATSRKNI